MSVVKRYKYWLMIIVACFIGMLNSTNSFATDGKTQFNVEPVFPKSQLNKNDSYYNLILKPNEKEILKVKVINKSNKEISVDLKINNASTNANGLIVYNVKEAKLDKSLTIPFTSIAKLKEKTIPLKAKETKEVEVELSLPKTAINGTILGGIYATESEDKEAQNNKGTGVVSRYGFSLGVAVRNDAETNLYGTTELKLKDVKPTIYLGSKTIQAEIVNPNSEIFQPVTINGSITKSGAKKPIAIQTIQEARFAPNSILDFNINLGKRELAPGKYLFKGKATLIENENKFWQFEKMVTINAKEANKLNEKAVVKVILPSWWFTAFYSLLGITILMLGWLVIRLIKASGKGESR